METKFRRVGIAGASGTGKTHLAKYITKTYQLPYLNSSSSRLWGKYGYRNHTDVHQDVYRNPDKAFDLQNDIRISRSFLLGHKKYLVTDRTPIDHAAYFLNYFQIGRPTIKYRFIEELKDQVGFFDAFIFVRFNRETIVEDNGVRITDPYYQMVTDSIMNMVIENNLLDIKVPILILDKWDWGTRVKQVTQFLNPY